MERLCLVSGPWQMLTLAGALRAQARERGELPAEAQQLAFLNRSFTPEIRQVMSDVAVAQGCWSAPCWLDDLLSLSAISRLKSFSLLLESLRKRIGHESISEIWINSARDWPEAFVCTAYPEAKIFVYEDGLATYFSNPQVRNFSWWQLLTRPALRQTMFERVRRAASFSSLEVLRAMQQVPSTIPERIEAASLFLHKRFPLAPEIKGKRICEVTPADLAGAILQVQEKLVPVTEQVQADSKGILFLAQTFSEGRFLTRKQEVEIYLSVSEELLRKGFVLYWKDHPRSKEPFYPLMVERFGSEAIRMAKTLMTMPIEVSMKPELFRFCVGGTSSSLFYLPDLFNIPAFQFAHEMVPYLHGGILDGARVVAQNIPSYQQLPALDIP